MNWKIIVKIIALSVKFILDIKETLPHHHGSGLEKGLSFRNL